MVIGPGFSVPIARTFLKLGEQINALPEHRKDVIIEAVKYLKKGESVYIFPEGDLNNQEELREFFTGIARIYLEFPCTVIPIGIVAPKRYVKEKEANITVGEVTYKTLTIMTGKYYANIGKPMLFTEYEKVDDKRKSSKEITKKIKQEIKLLIDDIKQNKFWN